MLKLISCILFTFGITYYTGSIIKVKLSDVKVPCKIRIVEITAEVIEKKRLEKYGVSLGSIANVEFISDGVILSRNGRLIAIGKDLLNDIEVNIENSNNR